MVARIAIDPNIRVRGNQTFAGIEDVEGDVAAGSHVVVYERESGLTGPAEVTEVDRARGLVYLDVDWTRLRERNRRPARGTLLDALAKLADWLAERAHEIAHSPAGRKLHR